MARVVHCWHASDQDTNLEFQQSFEDRFRHKVLEGIGGMAHVVILTGVTAHKVSLVWSSLLRYTMLSSELKHALPEVSLMKLMNGVGDSNSIALMKMTMTPILRRVGICNLETPTIGRTKM